MQRWVGWLCPICGWDGLTAAPYERFDARHTMPDATPPYENCWGPASYEVCACCGFEFGNDDNPGTAEGDSFETYRDRWLGAGAVWFDQRRKPAIWGLDAQLKRIGVEPDAQS